MVSERPLSSSDEIRQALFDLRRLTPNELDEVRGTIKEFDRSSRKMTSWLIRLTTVLVILTVVILVFTIVLAVKK